MACTRPARGAPVTVLTQQGVAAAASAVNTGNSGITNFPRLDRTQWIGKDVSAGYPNSAVSWQADVKRYSRTMTATNTLKQELFNAALEPRAYIGRGSTPGNVSVKIADVVRCVFAGALNAQRAKGNFMVGQVLEASNTILPVAKMGFNCVYDTLNVQPNWFVYYSNFDGTVVFQQDTLIRCDIPHLLTLELDGVLQQVRWYVDGTLIATYVPIAGTEPGQSGTTRLFPIQWNIYGSANGASTGKMDFLMGGVPLVTHSFLDT